MHDSVDEGASVYLLARMVLDVLTVARHLAILPLALVAVIGLGECHLPNACLLTVGILAVIDVTGAELNVAGAIEQISCPTSLKNVAVLVN